CYDCWEEFPEERHSYTLASIYGGLQAYALLSGHERTFTLAAIAQTLLAAATEAGHFVKFIDSRAVDASLLGIALPYAVFPPDHPLVSATVQKIEQTLAPHGGVHRYAEDTYYGGGEWVLLTAWLGWYYVEIGDESHGGLTLGRGSGRCAGTASRTNSHPPQRPRLLRALAATLGGYRQSPALVTRQIPHPQNEPRGPARRENVCQRREVKTVSD
ncbi:MAG: hypothetical protein GXP38_05325, partial [Chloroflexi bacterium]|nr:hypothetical protein [Chloroflexota bacterium]